MVVGGSRVPAVLCKRMQAMLAATRNDGAVGRAYGARASDVLVDMML